MENFDAYLFGYAAGFLTATMGESGKAIPESPYWGKQPYSYQAVAVQAAKTAGLLDVGLSNDLSFIMSCIKSTGPETYEDGSEKPLPMAQQGEWTKGFFNGTAKIRLEPIEEFLLTWRKRAGMSQESISKQLGVIQSQVSSWEKGKYKASKKHYWALISILFGYSDAEQPEKFADSLL